MDDAQTGLRAVASRIESFPIPWNNQLSVRRNQRPSSRVIDKPVLGGLCPDAQREPAHR